MNVKKKKKTTHGCTGLTCCPTLPLIGWFVGKFRALNWRVEIQNAGRHMMHVDLRELQEENIKRQDVNNVW